MNSERFAWLVHDTDLEWSRRDTGGNWLRVSRMVFARRSGIANDEQMIEAFLDYAKTPRNGRRYCLAWDSEQSADDALLLRYDT